ncbi:hypothetical protein A6U92_22270 [Agrobacterium rubi]|nr:hypothetical protein A6U92_22270 [Agrobacterium rubi]
MVRAILLADVEVDAFALSGKDTLSHHGTLLHMYKSCKIGPLQGVDAKRVRCGVSISNGFKTYFLTICKLLVRCEQRNVFFKQHLKTKRVSKGVITAFADCKRTNLPYFQRRKRGGGSSVFENTGMGQGMLSFSLRTQTLLKLDWRST